MANTLKFGNGEWYGKEGTILAYNSENNNYKPLPFTFDRASSATRVNKQGLIETVGADQPRVDYLNDSNGALLLEPERTNYQPYSTDFSVWGLSGATVNINYGLSPDGLNNSTLITEGTGSAQHRIVKGSPASSGIYTFSCFVRNKVGNRQAYIDMGAVTGFFNFDTKTMYSAAGTTNVESWSNDWYRISITSNSNITPSANYIGIGKNNTETFQGDGSSAIEFFAPQLEQGSYATSYIPTSGSAVTRLADSCNNGGNDQVINSTEGVLYAEIAALADDLSSRIISLSDGTDTNRVNLFYFSQSNDLAVNYRVSGSTVVSFIADLTDITNFSKVAFKWESGNFKMYVDGTLIDEDTNTTMLPSDTLDVLSFSRGDGSFGFYGNVKDVRVYNTALTDQELQNLTS